MILHAVGTASPCNTMKSDELKKISERIDRDNALYYLKYVTCEHAKKMAGLHMRILKLKSEVEMLRKIIRKEYI